MITPEEEYIRAILRIFKEIEEDKTVGIIPTLRNNELVVSKYLVKNKLLN